MNTNYCRLCMAEDHLELIDAFTRDAIHTEFSIVVLTNDELSREICHKCAKFVLKMIDFKRNVLNVQKVLKKVVKRNKNTIETESTENFTTSTLIDIKDENNDVSTNPKSSKKRKIQSHTSHSKRRKTTIKIEPNTTSEIPSDDSAVEEVDPTAGGDSIINIDDDDSNKKANPNLFPCKFCSSTFGFIETLGQHMKKHHDGHLCTKCGYTSVSAKSYAKHLRSHYNLTYNHRVCLSCFKICNDQAEFYAHKKLVHDAGKSSFVCSDCSEEYTTLEEFENHKRRVHPITENEDTQCDITSTQSVSVEDLEQQMPDSANIIDLEQSDENLDSLSEDQSRENTCKTDEPDDQRVGTPNTKISENCQSERQEVSENAETNCDTSQNADSSTPQSTKPKLEIPKIMDKKGRLRKPKFAKIFTAKTNFWLCRLCYCKKYSITDMQTHYEQCVGRRKCVICDRVLSCSTALILHKHTVHKMLLHPKRYKSHVKKLEQINQKQKDKQKLEQEVS